MSMRDAPTNYPDSMTAADHAYLDGDYPLCEHEDWTLDDTVSNHLESLDDESVTLRIKCVECGVLGYAVFKATLEDVSFD